MATRGLRGAGCGHRAPKTLKQVLRRVTGVIGSGDMYALLGPSGAGKTTLLDGISQRKTTGEQKGKVLFDSRRISKLRLKTNTAYIQQQDVLLGYFTVMECECRREPQPTTAPSFARPHRRHPRRSHRR